MPCFARVSGVMMICSGNADCDKSEQDWASCYYYLVVKIFLRGKEVKPNQYQGYSLKVLDH